MNQPEAPPALNRTAGVVMALSVLVLCGLGGFLHGQRKVKKLKLGWNLIPVVSATRVLPKGVSLTAADLAVTEMPEQFVTPQTVRDFELATLSGHTVEAPIAKGAMLRKDFVSSGSTVSASCIELTEAAVVATASTGEAEVATFLTVLRGGER